MWCGLVKKNTDVYAPSFWKIPIPECPDIWIRLPRHRWPKTWSSIRDPVVMLERNLCGHLLAELLWEANWESSLGAWLGESSWSRLLIRAPREWIILICFCDDDDIASRSLCRPASKWKTANAKEPQRTIHKSVSDMDSRSADSACIFPLMLTSLPSLSSLSSHRPWPRLLFLAYLRAFFSFFFFVLLFQRLILLPSFFSSS